MRRSITGEALNSRCKTIRCTRLRCIPTTRLTKYSALIRYYRAAFSIHNLKLAKEYTIADTDDNTHGLYKNSFYYRAFQSVPFKARRYLRRAEALETSVIPQARPSYIAEKGIRLSLIGQDGSIYFRYEHPASVIDKHEAAACVNRFAEQLFRVAVNRGTN